MILFYFFTFNLQCGTKKYSITLRETKSLKTQSLFILGRFYRFAEQKCSVQSKSLLLGLGALLKTKGKRSQFNFLPNLFLRFPCLSRCLYISQNKFGKGIFDRCSSVDLVSVFCSSLQDLSYVHSIAYQLHFFLTNLFLLALFLIWQ